MRRILIFIALISSACTRRPLSYTACSQDNGESATIAVSVDWSLTGFDTEQSSKSDEDYIHRVSLRFFPLDGSAAFDRYLEDDIEQGSINVPMGEYSVVVFNESIDDPYWQSAIEFENADSYTLFSAKIIEETSDDYFYTPSEGESMSVEALQLASYSIDNFVVSEAMCNTEQEQWSSEELAMAALLDPATPRSLTCYTTLEVVVENLSSANTVEASLTGLAQRVFMASGDTDTITTTHVGALTQRLWDDEDEQQHGTIYESRLTFSTPSSETSSHILTLDVILVDGSRHSPEDDMIYDVSDQIVSSAALTRYADNDLGASVSLSLPEVSGDVEVNAWGDENQITIQ